MAINARALLRSSIRSWGFERQDRLQNIPETIPAGRPDAGRVRYQAAPPGSVRARRGSGAGAVPCARCTRTDLGRRQLAKARSYGDEGKSSAGREEAANGVSEAARSCTHRL